jgi:lipoprotein-releasing system permease protein
MRWFISTRYFFTHKRQSLVCIAGVTISVAMFIAMDAMMAGFTDKFIIETVESSGHITIKDEPRETQTPILQRVWTDPNALLKVEGVKPREQVKKIKNPEGLMGKLRRMPGVRAVAPEVIGEAIATYGTKTLNVAVVGIDPEQQVRVTTIGEKLESGGFSRLRGTADGVVVGRGVAALLGVQTGDTLSLASSTGGRTTGRVVGIFNTGVTPVDYSRAYMLINNAQTLLDRKNIVNRIIIRSDNYEQASAFAQQIEALCGYKTESWQESNENFLKIFRIQTIITHIITGALLVVAAFGVLNILIMAVLERVNDIAILKSFGLSRNDVTVIYLLQGMVIGLIGAVLGMGCGKLAVELLRRVPIHLEGLVKAENLLMSERPDQYLRAFIAAMIVVTIAAVYPARRAAKYDPVEVIRGAH